MRSHRIRLATLFYNVACLVFGLTLLLGLGGCGPEEESGTTADSRNQQGTDHQEQSPLAKDTISADLAKARTFHDTGVETFAVGLGGDDVSAVMQGISLLEEATLADPDNNVYWIDLADAYISSDLAVFYPNAVDIYWMLYQEDESQRDALLSRLVHAYQKVGNRQAAFDAAALQLQQASQVQVNAAALQITWLAFANGRSQETVKSLVEKANNLDKPDFLLLLAASLKELEEDRDGSLKLIDQALAKLDGNSETAKLAQQMRGRLAP